MISTGPLLAVIRLLTLIAPATPLSTLCENDGGVFLGLVSDGVHRSIARAVSNFKKQNVLSIH